jgi:hypothetical protein
LKAGKREIEMAYRYDIDPSAALVLVSFTGSVSGDEVLQAMEHLFQDKAWDDGFDVIWEGTGIQELSMLPRELEKILLLTKAERGWKRGRDVIVTRREIDRSITQLYVYRARQQHQNVSMADSVEVALAQLGHARLPDRLQRAWSKAVPISRSVPDGVLPDKRK